MQIEGVDSGGVKWGLLSMRPFWHAEDIVWKSSFITVSGAVMIKHLILSIQQFIKNSLTD